MSSENIETFQNVLSKKFGSNSKIFINNISDLTLPGENYCSSIFKFEVVVTNENVNEQEERSQMNVVAKIVKNGLNEVLMGPAKDMFSKEIGFYTEIVPTLRKFQMEHGFCEIRDLFPDIVAFRKNVDGIDGDVDENVVVILENLNYKGKWH